MKEYINKYIYLLIKIKTILYFSTGTNNNIIKLTLINWFFLS